MWRQQSTNTLSCISTKWHRRNLLPHLCAVLLPREEETVYSYIYFACRWCRCRHAHIVWSANRTLCIPSAASRAHLHTRALLYLSPWYYAVANGRRKKASCFAPHMRRRHNRFWTRICACWIICTKRQERSAENEHRTQPGAHDTYRDSPAFNNAAATIYRTRGS